MSRDAEAARSAARVGERFAGALMAGDPATAAGLFSATGTCLSRDGTEVHGRATIEALLRQVTGSEHRLGIRLGRTLAGGPAALCTQYWTRRSKPPRREPFEETSIARLVLGRDGLGWEILIADPWGDPISLERGPARVGSQSAA